MKLSLVIPTYNEEGNVEKFYNEVTRVFDGEVADYELVFVNDGSSDTTMARLRELHREKDNIQVVSFSRNFGKEAAMYAGLSHARGELVCIIDADLQQRPEVVLEMLKVMDSDPDIDCVTAYQKKRREGGILRALKSLFYKIINKISEVDFVNGASDFRLMKRRMVDAILSLTEYHRFSKGIFGFVGFNTKYIPYEVCRRESGKTKWSPRKLFKYALDGIFAFSTAPLKISTGLGFLSALGSVIYLIVVIIQKLAFGIDAPGYATIVVLLLLIGGVQLVCLGMVGEYIARMYGETKRRPIYIEKEHLDTKNDRT